MTINGFLIVICIFLKGILQCVLCQEDDYCNKKGFCEVDLVSFRYLFYDVNPPEGFNLRRDVYLRFAVFANKMKNSKNENLRNIKLVLPPWSNLYHWNTDLPDKQFPWSYFFDLESLKKFAPVIEMHEFFQDLGPRYTKVNIDAVYILQHFEDMFKTNNFEDRMLIEPCQNVIQTSFFYYENITSTNIKCLSFHGKVSDLSKLLRDSTYRTILFDHAEVALHDWFGDRLYWQARRSMRFNRELVEIANIFRENFLNSTDMFDNTIRPLDWREERVKRDAKGGPYLSVHMRRRDFVRGRSRQVPTLKHASKQINNLLEKLDLNTVFIATDSPDKVFRISYVKETYI
ncbi:GDP-fucose protein O-fucosyltransferase 2 isoform X2 [Agrilus planipennis]|uniref:GDP-fucose protein O-fucosyltransferase 2 n=1 Tax=Agrilus planipennis TaxID=224129 RepID=A0A1W4WG69_AGRPL|nr:GDP-fucose protein O-fucosyltransferase 2 isoform X2 [Agrilus planipennis]